MLDRITGSLLGLAIGDALGYPVEFSSQTPDRRVVFDLQASDPEGALYSDDTQMTRAVCDGILDTPRPHRDFDGVTRNVAARFVEWRNGPDGGHRAPGGTCLRGVARIASGTDPLDAGDFNPDTGGGCGAVMRSAPYGWMWPIARTAASWAASHACMTHGAPIGRASSAAIAAAVSEESVGGGPPVMANAAVAAASRLDERTSRMIAQAMWLATPDGMRRYGDVAVLDRWRGWAGHEAIAASVYCFLRHPESYSDAVLLAVNSPGDSDSLGAITGALSGAYLGLKAIPEVWVARVEKSAQLLDLAARFAAMVEDGCTYLVSRDQQRAVSQDYFAAMTQQVHEEGGC